MFEGLDSDQVTLLNMIETILPKVNAVDYVMSISEQEEGEPILSFDDFEV